ncbi:MAG: membrane protein insertion efficiency factor YidD [Clostridia bacterium]|nr:membrane protein insertion efficiency factor YidD [Clostridia bacterium]
MKHIMIWLISLYRKFISPLKPPCCRFTPTCSAYAIEAFQKRGFFAGLILTTWRILRCNPFGRGGYDPVPEKGFKPYGGNRENPCETHTDTIDKEKEN